MGHPLGGAERPHDRAEVVTGRDEIVKFLTRKWNRELDYRLIKELWAFDRNRIAVRFAYEYHDDSDQWFRAYGNENWEFDDNGLMRARPASINDMPIAEQERKYHWPPGRRAADPTTTRAGRIAGEPPAVDRAVAVDHDGREATGRADRTPKGDGGGSGVRRR